MKRCEQGHLFDEGKLEECPYCSMGEDEQERVTIPKIRLDSDFARINAEVVENLSKHHLIYSIA